MHALLTGPLTTERIAIAIKDLPLGLHDTTLVQLTDFHFDGRSLSKELLVAAIAQCNAIRPDLIVLTGDYITRNTRDIYLLTAYLRQLKSRQGIYAVLGNHDSANVSMRLTIQEALDKAGITPLWNEITYPFGNELPLVGLADLRSRDYCADRLLTRLPPQTPRIVLAHNPDTFAELQSQRADLVLSGHTHGGQVALPGIGTAPGLIMKLSPWLPQPIKSRIPFLNKDCDRVFKHWEWAAGLHRLGTNQLYVNRGLGTYLPGRLFCPPELTVITLVKS
ncbi:metallophosphoesterase [Oscillatoria sp. CS-180]|uniref:metallophosphoesterase n=1 Tax=Oscillatoria sp. CS-180 TaxID=3021720 RepID=UPI00232C7697|nr:metallophosphoesterase [Oscillatoria sp. CS-180]MDB9527025.1 metallophosphoesterase [Oscillatoria sp. CS-180]